MALYGLAQRTANTATSTPSWEIRSAAGNKPKIMELQISQNGATAGVYGFGRPAAIGVSPTSVTFLDEGDGNGAAGQTVGAVAWGTAPTAPANFSRRTSCAATIGVGVIYTFPRGFGLPVSSSVVVWILSTAPLCDVSAVVDE